MYGLGDGDNTQKGIRKSLGEFWQREISEKGIKKISSK